jgi:ATP-dependent RNA helicase SUPV3L1/SUV3
MSGPAIGITALLGPTNTGKTHRAVERMLEHRTGMIGLPLRLLAREVYDRVTTLVGERAVALVTGEEKRVPPHPRYWVCTVESMPVGLDLDFVAVDEIQLAAHPQRGHTFTQRMLRARGVVETWLLGSDAMRPMVEALLPTARIERHPRFSRLSYVGTLALGGLPPRTAVVAFSVPDVYEIAERLRQRHGGTAVVLGALSPRTRNAQVAMYQAGEVHYLVATDAIGMGLNMDVDRVVFAALHKFDGSEVRGLEPGELGQIAGRAGRYTRDGGFGTLRPLPGLPPRVASAIETHQFPAIRRLVWRNDDLDFTSIAALRASLHTRPSHRALQVVARADDHDALMQMVQLDEVRARAQRPEDVELLWEVCRIPDFRKLMLDSHVQLLAEIFGQLSGPARAIDVDWMATRILRLDDPAGDIDTLTQRIAFIRTWTYVVNHEHWVPDAAHWQEITRAIEDRCSDALHERLTERFVAREHTGAPAPIRGRRTVRARAVIPAGPSDLDHPFAKLAGLAVPGSRLADPIDDEEDWADSIIEAVHEQLGLDDAGRIVHEGRVIARLSRGADILHPEPRLADGGELGAGARSRLLRRMVAWTRDAVGELLAPLRAVPHELRPSARGLLYQLERGLGTLDGRFARPQLEAITPGDRESLRGAGIVVTPAVVHVPALASAAGLRLRQALWIAAHEPAIRPELPDPRRASLPVAADLDPLYYPHVGYLVRGPRAIRADALVRAHAQLDTIAASDELPVELLADLGAGLGVRRRELAAVLRAMGVHGQA